MQISFLGLSFLAINGIAFLFFMVDKIMSKWWSRRIPEWVLFLVGLCFGATGAFLAMRFFRHKTRRPHFNIIMPVLMVVQLGLVFWW